MIDKRLAVVTGGNRGLGFETCRQLAQAGLKVLLTARDPVAGRDAAALLVGEGLDVDSIKLDVTDPVGIAGLSTVLRINYGRCDVLINNAGAIFDPADPEDPDVSGVLHAHTDTVRRSMEVNLYGPLRLIQEVIPVMHEHWYGRIVNVSTTMASFHEMGGGWPGYRLSKVALNALTRIVAVELEGTNIKVNAADPGWVRTAMGGEHATRSPQAGAATALRLATLPDDGPTGGFFRDHEVIPW